MRVLTYGTFDLFHVGHLRLLERLKSMGTYLAVGVSSDEFNAQKGKVSITPYEDRAAIVAACRFVDEVFPEHAWDQKRADIQRLSIDIFGMGNDWAGRFDDLQDVCRVVYLPRTDGVSSTALKGRIKGLNVESLETLRVAIETAQQVIARLA